MKKIIAGIAAGTMLLGMAATMAMAQDNNSANGALSQISQMQEMLNQLQGRLKGFTQSFSPMVQKMGEKMENYASSTVPSIMPIIARLNPGKSALTMNDTGNGRISVTIKNAQITAIDQPGTLEVVLFGLNWKIKVIDNAEYLRQEGTTSNFNEFAIGDSISANGYQDPADHSLITAHVVRNTSITKKEVNNRMKICIQMTVQAQNIKTGEIKTFPTPCAVPEGWKLVPTAGPTSTTPVTTSVTTTTTTATSTATSTY